MLTRRGRLVKTIQQKVEKPTLGDLGALASIKEKLKQEEKDQHQGALPKVVLPVRLPLPMRRKRSKFDRSDHTRPHDVGGLFYCSWLRCSV